MQYSSNSNEALRSLIRSCPTLIGQYRQAKLQIRDRTIALQQYDFALRRHDLTINQKEKLRDCFHQSGDCDDEAALINLEIAEAKFGIDRTNELIDDAVREIKVCEQELDRIRQESDIDFSELSQDEFQKLMVAEFRQKRVRWIAARTIAPQLGIPPESAEVLLELPEDDRESYLRKHHELVSSFNSTLDRLALNPQDDGSN